VRDAGDEPAHAGKQQQFLDKPGHDFLPGESVPVKPQLAAGSLVPMTARGNGERVSSVAAPGGLAPPSHQRSNIESREPASRPGEQVRADHQGADRPHARPHSAAFAARDRRRGDRCLPGGARRATGDGGGRISGGDKADTETLRIRAISAGPHSRRIGIAAPDPKPGSLVELATFRRGSALTGNVFCPSNLCGRLK